MLNEAHQNGTDGTAVPIRLRIPSELDYLATVRAFVQGACNALAPHLAEQTVQDLQLAINEACSNIIRHAYHGMNGQPVWLSAAREGEWLEFVAVDRGDTSKVSLTRRRLDDYQPADALADHGYGIILIQEIMDQLDYFQDPKRGNVLVMRKQVPRPQPGADRS